MTLPDPRRTYCFAIALLLSVCLLPVFASEENEDPERPHPHYTTPEARRNIAAITLLEGVTMGALLEIEASAGKADGHEFSDVTLATFQLGIAAEVTEGISGRALLLWEEDDTEPVDLDEAVITLGGHDEWPLSLTLGRLYLPFGAFKSHFVSDPLTLELAETSESALLLTWTQGPLDLQFAAFNADVGDDGDDDHTEAVVAAVTLRPAQGLCCGAAWISDLGQSDGLEDTLATAIEGASVHGETEPESRPGVVYEEVAGYSAFASLEWGRLTLEGEYIAAAEEFRTGLLGEEALEPRAWNAELAYGLPTSRAAELALKMEGSKDFPGFPKWQAGMACAVSLAEGTTLAAEFLHGEFDDDTEDRNVVTIQLALEL